ncbi:hypothetical protein POK33_38295 [Burkholderia cenocepacia]|uniref:hypothetical protein n=1 Tax=Burkholderia cenocepacia TaxID=95486 RepID=UPI0023BA39FA|nr:hypothetical protein [Burkholderia cenocepacia]MDF0506607.1 hypothetical protein [Burkholderia cenocepacia]
MKLRELAETCHWAFGLVIDGEAIDKQALNAARHFAGWNGIASIEPPEPPDPPQSVIYDPITGWFGGVYGGTVVTPPAPSLPDPMPEPGSLSLETAITDSEWAIIRPLFMLYVERENARALEASRGLGVDPYGRSVDQIEGDIRQYEVTELPRLAFQQHAETI